MKKWAPYRSLMEQSFDIEEETGIRKPTISNEQAEKINRVLQSYNNELILLTFYENHSIYRIETNNIKIKKNEKTIIVNKIKKIKIKDIIDIECEI